MRGLAATFILFLLIAGHQPPVTLKASTPLKDTIVAVVPQAVVIPTPDTIITKLRKEEPVINTGSVRPLQVVNYAKTLIGTRYVYGSADPKKGFDCSGFITYVFNHFNVKVPRSSVEFTDVGMEVNYVTSKPGDLILFTGTDSTIRVVGHMGIIVSNENNKLQFIHSTSGKQMGVTITELSPYYLTRFVRVTRVFPNISESMAVAEREDEGTIDEKPVKEGPKSPGTKKTSKTSTTKKVETKKLVKSKSTKSTSTKTVSTSKKSSTVKKTSVKKPVSSTKKTIQKTTPKTTTKKKRVTTATTVSSAKK
jgi:hypothetical protein